MTDALGYAASVAVLATFLMRTMLPLRVVAIASNVLFLAYGYFAHIPPVLFLHAALLPINVLRLRALRGRGACAPVAGDASGAGDAATGLLFWVRPVKFTTAGQSGLPKAATPQNEDSFRL
jgi:hypothetical protein